MTHSTEKISISPIKGVQELVSEFLEMLSPSVDPGDWTGHMVLRCQETGRWESVAITAGHVIRSFNIFLGVTNVPTNFENKLEVVLVSVGTGGSIRGDSYQMYKFVSAQEYLEDQGKSLGSVSNSNMVTLTTPPYVPGSAEYQIYKQMYKYINNVAGFYGDTVIQGWPIDTTLVYESTGLRVRCFRDSRGLVTMELDSDVSEYTDLGELYTDRYKGPLVTDMRPRTLSELVDVVRKILPSDPEDIIRLPLVMINHPIDVLEVGPTYSRMPYWLQSATDVITQRYSDIVGTLPQTPEVNVSRVMETVRSFMMRQGMADLDDDLWQQLSVEGLTDAGDEITIDLWCTIHNTSPVYKLVLSVDGDDSKEISLDVPYRINKVTVYHADGTTSIASDHGDDTPEESDTPFLVDITEKYLLHRVGMSQQRVDEIIRGRVGTIRIDFLVPNQDDDTILLSYSTMIAPAVNPMSAVEATLTKEQLHRIYITKVDIMGPDGNRMFSIIS